MNNLKYQEAKKWIEEIDSHPEWGHTEINWQAIDEIKELLGKQKRLHKKSSMKMGGNI